MHWAFRVAGVFAVSCALTVAAMAFLFEGVLGVRLTPGARKAVAPTRVRLSDRKIDIPARERATALPQGEDLLVSR